MALLGGESGLGNLGASLQTQHQEPEGTPGPGTGGSRVGGTEWGCPPAPRLQPTTCQASDSLRHRCGDHSHHNAPRVQGGVGSSEWGPTCFRKERGSFWRAP